jgi:hypothetical protein
VSLDALLASPLGTLLAFAGGAALVHRLLRALVRVALTAAEASTVGGLAEISKEQGDLTTMAERRRLARDLRRARTRHILLALGWLLLLAVPPLADVARPVFAAAAAVWLLPRVPIRPTLLRPGARSDARIEGPLEDA